ncbi:hypothetical protein D8B26_003451 [Coccidioides posadasii str. Silveira]|uniref:uncharacterized protein n=1 Tax=Coccidioides posadasii (strain RMSCC 757 / Silveira) TaxID=443226 RepID=UPI001BF01F2D|nr:hypothetical protein D8B26_003451 [Coccidioides posadasii str. Silveira]
MGENMSGNARTFRLLIRACYRLHNPLWHLAAAKRTTRAWILKPPRLLGLGHSICFDGWGVVSIVFETSIVASISWMDFFPPARQTERKKKKKKEKKKKERKRKHHSSIRALGYLV